MYVFFCYYNYNIIIYYNLRIRCSVFQKRGDRRGNNRLRSRRFPSKEDLRIALWQNVDYNAVHRSVPRYVGQTRR